MQLLEMGLSDYIHPPSAVRALSLQARGISLQYNISRYGKVAVVQVVNARMARRVNLRKYKRSSSCSEISDDNDIIYDTMSGDEYDEEKPKKCVKNIVKEWSNGVSTLEQREEDTSPLIPPRIKPFQSIEMNRNNSHRSFNLFSLSLDKSVQLPIIVNVIEGVFGRDNRDTFDQEDELLICSKVMTNYVTCVKGEDMFNIPINSRYDVALVNLDFELNRKTNETVKAILGMAKLPNRVLANSSFEINGIRVAQNQILEINGEGKPDPNAKYLRVQTLSGEDIEIPKSLKATFSCSISTRSLPLTIAIESCIFPQMVILIDKTNPGHFKKELCSLIECFSKKAYLACHYKGDVRSSLCGEDSLLELPFDIPLTFRIIGRPEDSHMISKRLELFSNKGFKIADDSFQKTTSTTPSPEPKRCNSVTDLRRIGCKQTYQILPTFGKPSTPEPEKSKHFFSKSNKEYSLFERNTKSPPPPPKPKGYKVKQVNSEKKQGKKDVRYPTPENIPKPKDFQIKKGLEKKEKPTETRSSSPNYELIEENKRLREKLNSLENSLSEKDIMNNEIEHKLGLLEVALAEANANIIRQEAAIKTYEFSHRTLPPLPGAGKSPPTSPADSLRAELTHAQKPMNSNPLPLTTKPKFPPKDPHYKSPRDYPREIPKVTESEYSDTVLNTSSVQYLATVLDKVNFGQYKGIFLQEGINIEMLAELDNRVLEKDLGIKTELHRMKLIKIAKKLKNKEDISNFYVDPDYIYGTTRVKLYEKIN